MQFETSIGNGSGWAAPRLYDEQTETLTPSAFALFGGALVDEAKEQQLPLALVVVGFPDDLDGSGQSISQLVALANVLRRSLRSGDVVGRYAPATFALLIKGAGSDRATHVARWIQAVMSQWCLDQGQSGVLLCQGIDTLEPGEGELPALIERANQAYLLVRATGGGIRRFHEPETTALARREVAVQEVAPDAQRVPANRKAGPPVKKRRKQVRRTTPRDGRDVNVGAEDGGYELNIQINVAVSGQHPNVKPRIRFS